MTPTVARRDFFGFAIGAFVVAAVPLARRRPPGLARRTVQASFTAT